MHSLPTSFHIQDSFHVLISVIYNHILKLCLYLSRCLFRSTNAFHLLTYSTCSFYLLQVQCFPKYVVSWVVLVFCFVYQVYHCRCIGPQCWTFLSHTHTHRLAPSFKTSSVLQRQCQVLATLAYFCWDEYEIAWKLLCFINLSDGFLPTFCRRNIDKTNLTRGCL